MTTKHPLFWEEYSEKDFYLSIQEELTPICLELKKQNDSKKFEKFLAYISSKTVKNDPLDLIRILVFGFFRVNSRTVILNFDQFRKLTCYRSIKRLFEKNGYIPIRSKDVAKYIIAHSLINSIQTNNVYYRKMVVMQKSLTKESAELINHFMAELNFCWVNGYDGIMKFFKDLSIVKSLKNEFITSTFNLNGVVNKKHCRAAIRTSDDIRNDIFTMFFIRDPEKIIKSIMDTLINLKIFDLNRLRSIMIELVNIAKHIDVNKYNYGYFLPNEKANNQNLDQLLSTYQRNFEYVLSFDDEIDANPPNNNIHHLPTSDQNYMAGIDILVNEMMKQIHEFEWFSLTD